MRIFLTWLLCCLAIISSDSAELGSNEKNVLHFISEKFNILNEPKSIIVNAIIDKILNIYAPVSNAFDNDLCRNHSQIYKEGVKTGQLWAVKMFDSSSKLPDGVLMGNLADFGNFDECVQIENIDSELGQFSGQHCMVSIGAGASDIPPEPQTFLNHVLNEEYTSRSGVAGVGGVGLSSKWSVCIPSSCRSHDLQLHLQSTLPGVLGDVAITVNELRCNTNEKTAFRASDWFAVGFMSFFGILVVMSTAYDLYFTKSESRHPLLLAFSMYSNGNKLLNAPPSSDSLPALHGVRFWSMMWVVLGHRYFYYAITPAINTVVIVGFLSDWKHMFITNATLSVDSFFLLSGILVCYIFLKEMEKGTRFNVPLYYLHRYIRLTPPYAVIIMLSATLLNYMDDGPMWRSNMEYSKVNCEDNWWTNILYVNNYVHSDGQCVGQSWYLAVDMQLFWISPLLLYPLWRWPKFGKSLLAASIVAGLLTAFLVPFINEIRYSILSTNEASSKQYFGTHTRFTPWLLGIALGYVLHHTKHTTLDLSRLTVAVGWLTSAVLLLTSWLLAHHFTQPGHEYERFFESLFTCLMRPAWSAGLAWVIFACIKGYGGFINTFLSWSVFQVLGRLTYTVYLVHFSIMAWFNASTRTPEYIRDRLIFTQFFGDLFFSFAAAFVLSVVFESPAIIIEKYLLGKCVRQKKDNSKSKLSDVEKNDLKKSIANIFEQDHVDVIVPKSTGLIGETSDAIRVSVSVDDSSDTGVDNVGFLDEDIASPK